MQPNGKTIIGATKGPNTIKVAIPDCLFEPGVSCSIVGGIEEPRSKQRTPDRHYDHEGHLVAINWNERIWVPLTDEVELPRRAATAVTLQSLPDIKMTKPYGIGIATENQPGYTPFRGLRKPGPFTSWEEAEAEADHINETVFGLDKRQAYNIVASSMRNGGVRRN